jgi:uncharacterized membrane protein YtjA (UPF0391 family)
MCDARQRKAVTLLKWALVFFLISIVAGVLGFTGISTASADIARILFYIFVVIFLVLLIPGAEDLQGLGAPVDIRHSGTVRRRPTRNPEVPESMLCIVPNDTRQLATSSIFTLSG